MSRVLIRANADLADLARGEEVEVDYDQRTRQREANGLVTVLAPVGEEAPAPRTDSLNAAQIVANSTVADVVEWVGDNPDRALAARDAERARQAPRSTLLSQLDAVFSDEGEA